MGYYPERGPELNGVIIAGLLILTFTERHSPEWRLSL